jgi:oxygen-independent coproporphyrinogen-3 oxidase
MRAVYVHIPFCNSICSYCDFCKFLNYDKWNLPYLEALEKEIDEYYEGDEVKTIYIGGGTPSALNERCIDKLFHILRKIHVKKGAEITFECNVNDITESKLKLLKKHNVNRISVGVESFNKYNLKFLNRKHDKKLVFEKINLCKNYFDNINVDLIYALPTENMGVLRSDINNLLKLDIQHISTYSLIIEENTALYVKKVKNVSEELDAKMYKYICKKLFKKGFIHYEVSNFAKEGYESRHNLTYWNNEEYYGFGVGAHGYINNMRYENTRGLNKYMSDNYRLEELLVSNQEEMENEIILGLRKLKGISVSEFERKYQRSIFEAFNLEKAILKSYLVQKGDYLYIPEDKIYIMNEIINMIM